jgi:predicted DNA-binding transcriptional regulator AlpA
MKEFKTVDIDYMAKILHKTRRTLEVDVSRRPESLPPRLNIPGSRKVLWLEEDVFKWLQKCRT